MGSFRALPAALAPLAAIANEHGVLLGWGLVLNNRTFSREEFKHQCIFSLAELFYARYEEFRMAANGNGVEHDFWTAKEAARYARIATRTLYNYCRYKPTKKSSHRVDVPPFRRIGRNKLLFPIDAFKEWLARFDVPSQER